MRPNPGRSPKRLFAATVALFAALAALPAVAADAPPLINYQGVLRDTQGLPLDGSFDMTFGFYDQSVGGSQILVDTHSGAAAIVVTDGLFNATLGGGAVADGSAVLPGDPYLSLASVFRDFEAVWMEIGIGAETLSPRVRVVSSAYALNASHLAGRPPASFLDTSGASQSKSGSLAVFNLFLNGALLSINGDGPDGDQFIGFFDGGVAANETLKWDEANDRFEFTNALAIAGPLRTGSTAQPTEAFNHLGNSVDVPDSADMTGVNDLYVEGDVEMDGSLYLGGQAFMRDAGPDADQNFWFFNNGSRTGEDFKWDEAGDRFEFSDSLALAGALRAGSSIDADEAFNHFGNLGDAPDSEDITGTHDVYVEGDIELESTLYLAGEILMRDFGGDASQTIFFYDGGLLDDEWFTWDDGADRFEMSDSLHVYGELTALTKNFVQNHPDRADLEVVYTSLEGDEPAVFTRGSARLEGGVARVALGGSFGLVANPSVGLSAHLTPRGGWADLYVESLTPTTLVVRARPGAEDVAFDFVVFGLRAGWEEFPVFRPRRADAPVPADGAFEPIYAAVPEARALSPLARHAAMETQIAGDTPGRASGRPAGDPAAARRLRDAIGARDGSEPARPPRLDRSADRPLAAGAPAAPAPLAVASAAAPVTAPTDVAPLPGAGSRRAGSPVAPSIAAPADAPGAATHRTSLDFALTGPVEPGDLLVLDPDTPGTLRRSFRPSDAAVVGVVVSLDAGLSAGGLLAAGPADGSGARVAIAVAGVALVHVDATYGAIRPGDLLAASDTPGHAMRAAAALPGTLIGKALDAADAGTATIRVLLVSR